ncbi:MAG: shikimate kinase [Bacteroidetes bacterium]|jgi:shikimate kinase|nr:shikimate kinase [Bacteroidota bacterium]
MGCGKSTHGKKIAGLLKMSFVDLDAYIQKKESKTVQFIFDNEGENEFRRLETKYLNEIVNEKKEQVISLGGGTVCYNDNLSLIKKNGVLIYIEMSPAALASRLEKSKQKRPLLKNVLSSELESFIEKKLQERNQFYKQAHIIVKGIDLNHLQLHQLLIDYK